MLGVVELHAATRACLHCVTQRHLLAGIDTKVSQRTRAQGALRFVEAREVNARACWRGESAWRACLAGN